MSETPPNLPEPGFDLEAPGTYLYSGPASTQGFRLNRFALSLKRAENRDAFLADEAAYMARYGLTDAEKELVAARDWTGLIQAGGHLLAMLKIAATLGLNLYDIGAHHVGTDRATLYGLCPRTVSATPDGQSGEGA